MRRVELRHLWPLRLRGFGVLRRARRGTEWALIGADTAAACAARAFVHALAGLAALHLHVLADGAAVLLLGGFLRDVRRTAGVVDGTAACLVGLLGMTGARHDARSFQGYDGLTARPEVPAVGAPPS